ncbi:MAG TPA: flagellar export chaperone FlgN [Deltaproteobacteria bacterium]|nr:flagellar export chaperone FlgN [Deltaproteobacteria bacterium]HPR55128.1 flagellar export chaperone FlgN [Deltaproteobacteria bacterium]HXK47290.1 flagellar export chaperone FlgN [Deltaproteobacteria bacterium]
MTYTDMIARLEQEKELVGKLNALLQQELDLIASDEVQALEESMPAKRKVIRSIAEMRRNAQTPSSEPSPEEAKRMRILQQDLVRLWKKATGLNDISKRMVTQRLSEIDDAVQSFFTGLKESYTRDGRKAAISLHTIKTGA